MATASSNGSFCSIGEVESIDATLCSKVNAANFVGGSVNPWTGSVK